MDINLITQNERDNDGKTIYMYFNDEVGFYTAYGFSAFLVAHVVEPVCSFSPGLQMPVVLIDKYQVLELRRSLNKLSHTKRTSYQFSLRNAVGTEGYEKWVKSLAPME